MNVLVTGAAGFIGYHVIRKFIKLNHRVFGVDNLNSYYDVNLKKSRIKNLNNNIKGKNFSFYKISIEQTNTLEKIFKKKKIDIVINLEVLYILYWLFYLNFFRLFLENSLMFLVFH